MQREAMKACRMPLWVIGGTYDLRLLGTFPSHEEINGLGSVPSAIVVGSLRTDWSRSRTNSSVSPALAAGMHFH
jgi:hypothetical protein